ncbi:hypothetical protein Psuf_002410 [Phytohabitans suffuscus]|uniref:ABC-2 type transporter domain-containing protein n=2 Tax=Phytohabitans suffuscus TaxID=624315 RepID=A0A6F8YAB9_9ACTN|nr:hypothetical protein Psuf_002410 [Phytohabitans suffuscus]
MPVTTSSLRASRALLLRDVIVLREHLGEFALRTVIQPFLLCFVFLYVFPEIGQGVGGGSRPRSGCRSSRSCTHLPRMDAPRPDHPRRLALAADHRARNPLIYVSEGMRAPFTDAPHTHLYAIVPVLPGFHRPVRRPRPMRPAGPVLTASVDGPA